VKTGELRCTELLAGSMAYLAGRTGDGELGAGDFEQLEHGVAATLHTAAGDRYRVSVEWLGDREGSA
jgi:hypothetical protein